MSAPGHHALAAGQRAYATCNKTSLPLIYGILLDEMKLGVGTVYSRIICDVQQKHGLKFLEL